MTRTPRILVIVGTAVLWSGCQSNRPIVTVNDDAGSGTAGTGGSGPGVGGNPAGGHGGAATPCDGAAVFFCADATMVCSLADCPGGPGGVGGNPTGGAMSGVGGNPAGGAVSGVGGNPAGGAVSGVGGNSAGGTTGAAGTGQVGVGTLIDCPASPPSGACSPAQSTCAYANTTCHCMDGSWSCAACPTVVQANGFGGMCRIGTFTCSLFGCGVCPDAHPTEGAVCGNTMFKCQYGNDACLCGGDVDGWRCGTLSCPQSPASDRRTSCASFALSDGTGISFDHTCSYQAENQACACTDGTGFGTFYCSCPAAAPAEGSACIGPNPCTYAGVTCNCANGHWHCGGACPASKPAVGAACSSQVSCVYMDSGRGGLTEFCACNGSAWSCS